ncbi:MAG: hypothetical protein IKY46_04005 [Clostridia bacterium]|nr:hypothetical protein [Clostridia bacterium]
MVMIKLYPVDLTLFDGAGDASGSSAVAGQNTSGDTSAHPAAEGNTAEKSAATDKESKRKAYMALINGEYKDIHTEESQRMINTRFKDSKKLEKQLAEMQPFVNLMHTRYGTNGDMAALTAAFNKDSYFWGGVAEERGGTEDTARKNLTMETELRAYKQREQLDKWNAEIAAMQEKYPEFDIDAEMSDPEVRKQLKSGIPLERIYRERHMDDFIRRAVETAAADTERRVTESIRAKGNRPDENGTQSSAGYVARVDVSKLTPEQRKEYAARALRGEFIDFSR